MTFDGTRVSYDTSGFEGAPFTSHALSTYYSFKGGYVEPTTQLAVVPQLYYKWVRRSNMGGPFVGTAHQPRLSTRAWSPWIDTIQMCSSGYHAIPDIRNMMQWAYRGDNSQAIIDLWLVAARGIILHEERTTKIAASSIKLVRCLATWEVLSKRGGYDTSLSMNHKNTNASSRAVHRALFSTPPYILKKGLPS